MPLRNWGTAGKWMLAASLLTAGAGCGQRTQPVDNKQDALTARLGVALNHDPELAAKYGAFYQVLAERLDDTDRPFGDAAAFAAVAGDAGKLLKLPGRLNDIAGSELNPALTDPGALTPERVAAARVALGRLAESCRAVSRSAR